MKLLVLAALLAAGACRHCPEATCPTLPARAPAPAPVVVVKPRPPCLLPDRPEPVTLDLRASGDDVLLPRAAAVQLLAYLTALRARDEAATACFVEGSR